MARLLNGSELQGFIKTRQLQQVRNLRQEYKIVPKLCIVVSDKASDVINTYIRMKRRYAEDISIEVDVRQVPFAKLKDEIERANDDESVQGIILQLPIDDPSKTEELCGTICSDKDVDGLGKDAGYLGATAQAIDWLLVGYNVELKGKRIVIVGNGKLVGGPLSALWKAQGLNIQVLDENSSDVAETLLDADVIVSAVGAPSLIKSASIKPGAVVVDAGTTSEDGVIVGDVETSARERQDITITPIRGGVGPLTYTVLFDHLIEACLKQAGKL